MNDDDSREVTVLPSVPQCQSRESVLSNILLPNTEMITCEKADLERHEKESPSDDDSTPLALVKVADSVCSRSDDEGSISRSKLHKTNENIAVVSSYSHLSQSFISQTESHVKLNKTNENNAVIASCSNLTCSDNIEFPTKMDKTNENNSVIASSSVSELLSHSSSSASSANIVDAESLEADRKLPTTADSSTSHQNSEISKHTSVMNCDHKTSLNIANSMYIQAEKSSNKSKIINTTKNNNCPSTLNDRPTQLIKQNLNCEYRVRCLRFRNFLGLPGEFM